MDIPRWEFERLHDEAHRAQCLTWDSLHKLRQIGLRLGYLVESQPAAAPLRLIRENEAPRVDKRRKRKVELRVVG